MCGTWPLSAKLDFHSTPFHTLRELIAYMPTKFRENILIGGRDMPPKRNSKRALWRRNSTFGFSYDKCHLSGTFLYMILLNFKKIAQRAAELYAIQLFLYLHCQRHHDTVPSCRQTGGPNPPTRMGRGVRGFFSPFLPSPPVPTYSLDGATFDATIAKLL